MADRSNFFIMQLFHEMKQRFPAIPDRIVSECIRQNFNDKQICEAVLTVKNRNYCHRLFPSPQAPKMVPVLLNEGVPAVSAIDASTTESETESSKFDDDAVDDDEDDTCNTSGSCAPSETEECEISRVPLKMSGGAQTAVPGALASTSSTAEVSDTRWRENKDNSCELYQVPPNFGPQLSQEGCGRGIGGGCCCRHAEDMDFFRQLENEAKMAKVDERQSATGASVLSQENIDTVIDGLGDRDFFYDQLSEESRKNSNTKYPLQDPPLSVSVPGVQPPPCSHLSNLSNLSAKTSHLNLSDSCLKSEFESFRQVPKETRTSQEMHETGFEPSESQMPRMEPPSPTYKPPYSHDPNIEFGDNTFMDEPSVLSHDVENFLVNVNCSLTTSGGSSHLLDGEDETRRFEMGAKGRTLTSSTVKVSTSSPVFSPQPKKYTNQPGLQPSPVFAGHSRSQATKDRPPSMGSPVTPTKYANTPISSMSSQLVETPLSYTTVNLRVRQPSSDPLPPIDIRSSVGDSTLTYTSASSYYPQPSFQSELQIRIGGDAGMSCGYECDPITSSWKSQAPPSGGKNLSSKMYSPVPQTFPTNQSNKHQVLTNRSGEKPLSPLPTRREQAERPRSLYRPLSPESVSKIPHASGSLPDVSKARSFSDDPNKSVGNSAIQSGVQNQPDPRVRKVSSVPSTPVPSTHVSGLPPAGPSASGFSSKDKNRVCETCISPSSIEHPLSTCPDISRCKALLKNQIERKNLLERELNREHARLKNMLEEAHMMEKDLKQRQMRQRSHATLPIIQRVHTLRQEIRILQEECKKMTNEVDMHSDVQVPLGETDEEFYKNIYTGQCGWVLLPPTVDEIHSSQEAESFHQYGRESRERRRDNPLPTGMEAPREMEGEQVRGSAGEDNSLGSGAGGEGPNWTCSVCTFRNHPALHKCEQCEMPRHTLGMNTGDALVLQSQCYYHILHDAPSDTP